MQLHRIREYIAAYKKWLPSQAARKRLYYWESQQIWQANWDLDEPDLRTVYDRSLENSQTRRLWKREAYEPKRMLMEFLAMEPEFVRPMFKDLFDETKSVDRRADRFIFYCDQLMEQYRKAKPLAIDTRHYHEDGYEMISLYLAFQYPDQYAPYQAERFLQLLKAVGAQNIPPIGDFPRHCKVMRTLQSFLLKDEEVVEKHAQRLVSPILYQEPSLLLAFDFAAFVVGK